MASQFLGSIRLPDEAGLISLRRIDCRIIPIRGARLRAVKARIQTDIWNGQVSGGSDSCHARATQNRPLRLPMTNIIKTNRSARFAPTVSLMDSTPTSETSSRVRVAPSTVHLLTTSGRDITGGANGISKVSLSPNPPKDTDGRREESGRGVCGSWAAGQALLAAVGVEQDACVWPPSSWAPLGCRTKLA